MTIDSIIKEAEALPVNEQRELMLRLQSSVLKGANSRRRYETLRSAAAAAMNVDNIEGGNRVHERVWARYLVSWQMRMEGYTLSEIGRCIQRDHSTVVHGIAEINNVVENPECYPAGAAAIREFIRIIKESEQTEHA